MKYALLFIAAFLFPLSATAQNACREMGCESGFHINLPYDYHWQPGSYDFAVTMDGITQHCTGSLPFKGCDKPGITCPGTGVMIVESGCAMPPETHGFGDISVSAEAQHIAVTITRDGTLIGTGEWSPAYNTVQPNGVGCEPICRQASATLSLKP